MTPRHLTGDPVTARSGFFWVGGEPVELPHGTAPRGQMFVQWMAPAEVTKPYPLVLVHGGGGQSTDWLGTPDGRTGWATFLIEQGYALYIVDRPGHGRSPFSTDVLGPTSDSLTLELTAALFTDCANGPFAHPTDHLHSQWPGSGKADDPAVRQFNAGAGPMITDHATANRLEQDAGAALLDEIGPAILVTASAGGPMGWLVADARPELVKAIVAIEPAGPPFFVSPDGVLSMDWGVTAAPLTFEPPAASPADLADGTSRTLPALAEIPIAIVSAESSWFGHHDPATAEFLTQAGCRVDRILLHEHGVHGNGHLMMLERNNREALGPILAWLDQLD